ncbi:hypothetical protein P152DRAFT_459538 [Eremomyces bilateralis CBS 781.70]|uniref:Parallel beta-helix repeat protein n=1 Tax=Eremomyces bilateralis CBS 781.70 TaxID=1392243 RepID=A0A6G1G1B7_9PEZI|nr:uncharacterized protein P152DRAFT_459538 [Eremomyces bilateralis CBS 781.70]KAF1811599.1 hypothetical protein P152DRAFT_459538 [Eremomyces bilateralis CBS 781.70]
MVQFFTLTAVLTLVSIVHAQCGAGTPDAKVTGSGGSFTATRGANRVYSGSNYHAAIQAALDSIQSGQRVSVIASGSIGTSTISIGSGKIFEGCGTINAALKNGRGAIESLNTQGTQIPYLTMTGDPYFGLRFYGTRDLVLGQITMNMGGKTIGIRFDRDQAANSNVKMDVIRVTGAGGHAVETWNIDGLEINQVIARNVGESALLLQKTTNAKVKLVDGENVGKGTGYATFRMANNNGQNKNGDYKTNIYIDKVVSRGGGRGVFCVSQSGAVVIESVDLANNGNNAILIENCYNVAIRGGTVNGGGEVRLSARTEFPKNRDISLTLTVNNNSVRESPCGDNTTFNIKGNAKKTVC